MTVRMLVPCRMAANAKESEYMPFSLVYHGMNDRRLQVRGASPRTDTCQ